MENQPQTLDQIVSIITQIEERIIEAGGELTPETEKHLQEALDNLSDKVDGYYHAIERLSWAYEYWSECSLKYERRAAACDRTRDFLKRHIENQIKIMRAINPTESRLRGREFTAKLVESAGRVVIKDEDRVPDKYVRKITNSSFMKAEMLADLKRGEEIPGVDLEKLEFVRFSANSDIKKPQPENH